MDGEAILAALDVGPNALATMVASLGKRLKLFRLMQQEKDVGIVIYFIKFSCPGAFCA